MLSIWLKVQDCIPLPNLTALSIDTVATQAGSPLLTAGGASTLPRTAAEMCPVSATVMLYSYVI